MPVRDETDALNWAKREHQYVMRLENRMQVDGENAYLRKEQNEARRKRSHALLQLRMMRGQDPAIPVHGTDAEVGAYLGGVDAPRLSPSARALTEAAARRAGGGA